MALINIDDALREAVRLVKKCDPQSGVELLSYKRNRTISLIRLSDSMVQIRENGYLVQETTIELSDLLKNLKPMLKREFPRSRKVRVFKITSVDQLLRTRQKI